MGDKKKSVPKKKARQPKKKIHPTKSKKTEATLKVLYKSQKRLSLALDSAHTGIWEWDIKKDEIWWSEYAHQIFGTTKKNLFEGGFDSFAKFIHPNDKGAVEQEIKESLSTGKKYFIQHRIVKADGSVRWVESVGKVFRSIKGNPIKMMGSVQDITDLKQSDFERKGWEERYNLIASSSGQIIYDYDLTSGTIAWSGTLYNVLGYADHEIKSNTRWKELVHPEDKKFVITQFERAKQNVKPYDLTYRFKAKSKAYVHIHDKGFFQTNSSGQIFRMLGTMQDITDKVKIEAELIESNRFKASMENAMPGMLYVYDLIKGVNVYINHHIQALLGFDWEEIESMGNNVIPQLIHPEDISKIPQWSNEPTRTVKDFEYRMRTKSGDWRWFHSRDTVFQRDRKGNVTQIIGIAQDITSRKQAEELLSKSEESYRELFNMVGQEIYILNPDGTFLDVNEGACKRYEYSKHEFIGNTPEFLSVEGRNNDIDLEQVFSNALKGIPQTIEWWGKKKSGGIFLREVRISKGLYFGKNILIALAWDVTQRRLTENAVRESEKYFRSLIENLNVGVSLHDANTEIILSNHTAHRLLGVEGEQLIGKTSFDTDWNMVREDGTAFPAAEHPVVQARETLRPVRGIVIGVLHPVRRERIWLLVNAEPLLAEQPEDLEIICTFTDITERKKIEEALKESELRFRTLQEASFGGICLHDHGIIIDVNQGLCDITGYRREELVGHDGLHLITPESRELVMQNIISEYEKPYDVEGIHKDGTRYFLEVHGKNIPYQGRNIRVTEFRNITSRKLTEEKILEQNARLQSITIDLKRKNDQLEEFTQIVSHNLRSPMGNILTLLNFMENSNSEEDKAQFMKYLKESSNNALTTLEELNEVLKLKQNKNIEKQHLEFDKVFAQVKAMVSAKIGETSAEVCCDFSQAPTIWYPHIYLESIFLNLLSNALKYSKPGVNPVIEVRTYCDKNDVILEVMDNGLGINLERYGHQIFKLQKTFHKHPESRGIGLFMIKNQIEAMGGEISLTSQEQVGTTFIVNFNKHHSNEDYIAGNRLG